MKYPINVMCLNHHTPLPNARTHTHTHPHTLIVKKTVFRKADSWCQKVRNHCFTR